MTRMASPSWQYQILGFTSGTSMLEFTGPYWALIIFTSTAHKHADTLNCRANVYAHTHMLPAYVLSYQTHNPWLWTLPTLSAPFAVCQFHFYSFPHPTCTDRVHEICGIQVYCIKCSVTLTLSWILSYVHLDVTHLSPTPRWNKSEPASRLYNKSNIRRGSKGESSWRR